MNSFNNIVEFSENGEYVAYSSPDGCLKIWEASTNILKQEYTPSAHLSATCSSLRWGPCKQTTHGKKKAKISKGDAPMTSDLHLIAMGTLTGDVLLYSFTTAELHSVFKNGHNGTVNDLCWLIDDDSLYSCSSDQHIVIWSLSSGKIKTKWKVENNPIHSICVIDDSNLLSSSHSIKWWDTKQKVVIKSFIGHATEVFRMLPVKSEKSGNYFLSAAIDDRIINAWHLSENGSQKPVAKFLTSDEPQNINLTCKENKPLLMSVVSKDGSLHLFEHMLNGRVKRPLEAKVIVQVGTKSDELAKPQLMPILAVNISEGINSCLLMYGSFIKPIFEKIDLSDAPRNHFLVRHSSLFTSDNLESSVSKIKKTDKSGRVKVLAPGHMMTDGASQSISRKRKKEDKNISDLPMEERLKALALSKIPESIEETESTVTFDSMVHLLLQGLQSKDNNMLNSVLQSSDEQIIHNTVQRLPLQSIFLLLKELHERLNKQEPRNHACLKWIKGLLAVHLPYLLSCKDIDEYLGPISQLIEARLQNFPKMSQLHGCLNILLSQASENSMKEDTTSQPLNVYVSESSEESESEEEEEDEMVLENQSDHEDLQSSSDESESSNSENDMES
ncbi:WD repeat-containing protein 43-like [Uloborus diversus]|uniref:WD repeat-containing protein 43-like n=1 Tax=Uloborus diversus TaxID=327109 RepID=UPI0024091796|nr:WD repeat-containing protein 43-like [Uloborus diversus]